MKSGNTDRSDLARDEARVLSTWTSDLHLTVNGVSSRTGIPWQRVRKVLERNGIDWRARTPCGKTEDRDRQIRARVKTGEPYGAIGRDFGLTRERVRQIVKGDPRRGKRKKRAEATG